VADVTLLLDAAAAGDRKAAADLLPLVYDELRKLAAQRFTAEAPGQTLQPTALVHEAYVRLVGPDKASQWNSRGHFFAAAAQAMRRILVENVRRKRSLKHGGDRLRQDLAEGLVVVPEPHEDLLALDEALNKLAAKDARKAQLVQLRYFAGLTMEEAAQALCISSTTAERYWTYARAWLQREIGGGI
jgi:RNA polymerase sigma factor (TIGR02999 family)